MRQARRETFRQPEYRSTLEYMVIEATLKYHCERLPGLRDRPIFDGILQKLSFRIREGRGPMHPGPWSWTFRSDETGPWALDIFQHLLMRFPGWDVQKATKELDTMGVVLLRDGERDDINPEDLDVTRLTLLPAPSGRYERLLAEMHKERSARDPDWRIPMPDEVPPIPPDALEALYLWPSYHSPRTGETDVTDMPASATVHPLGHKGLFQW